jgi:hypothetical protein
MVVRCLPVGRRVQALADRGERDVVEQEPRGLAGLRMLLPQPAIQAVIAGRVEGAARCLTHMR